MTVIATADWR